VNLRTIKRRSRKALAGAGAAALLVGTASQASAEEINRRVVEANLKDGNPPAQPDTSWYRSDTRPGGGVILTDNPGHGIDPVPAESGLESGSLALTTNGAMSAKAQLGTTEHLGTPLGDVTGLSYWTYQSTQHTGLADGLPSYQLVIDTNGDAGGGFTTLVYEPYNNEGPVGSDPQQPFANDEWQQWDATGGDW
jgi:hypothetical protein